MLFVMAKVFVMYAKVKMLKEEKGKERERQKRREKKDWKIYVVESKSFLLPNNLHCSTRDL